MPGGKVHGQGGHGRFFREQQRGYAHRDAVEQRIERAQEAGKRREERKFGEFLEKECTRARDDAIKALQETANAADAGRMRPRESFVRLLAVNAWWVDFAEKELLARRFISEPLSPEERERISLIDSERKNSLLIKLLGENPSIATQKETLAQIEKWKGRVPGILKGHY